ncbi:MAG: putative zinc-binding metallopeptidase [Gemmatimonadota bacterium]|nr:putative zinc-binding metallopeptidase [Gemmatimonadota bacterium]
MKRRFPWATWSTERLLQLRIKDLGLTIEGTWLEPRVHALHETLERRGVRLRPHIWLSEEWFSPQGVPGFAIPFYLAHPRLIRLERSQMLDVEGGTRGEFTRIIRHETGHAIQHGYQLQRRRAWQRLFGKSSERYPDYYRPNPASKRYVQHLRLWYAQSHPDEDFAETFAVWLRPRSEWRKRYAGWPALRKLEYVDELMGEIVDRTPLITTRQRMEPVSTITKTLAQHYAERKAKYSEGLPDIYDRDLRRIFSDSPAHRNQPLASVFLRRHRTEIRRMVAKWTGEYEFTLDVVLGQMLRRSRELRLRAVGGDRQLRMDFAVLLTVKTMHFLYSEGRRDWIAL